MKRLPALLLSALLLTPAARGAKLTLDGSGLDLGATPVYENTTYVSLRAFAEALRPAARVAWTGDRASAQVPGLTLTARPGEARLAANGDAVSLSGPVRLEEGRTLVPLRPLAALFGLAVSWDPSTGDIALATPGEEAGDLYWLSRIISAESQGECWEGKIAVGNVILNRVKSPDFPDTIYGVIFDDRWGGQFTPVRNGAVYLSPTEESVAAARACLAGENTAGDSLYFLAPSLTTDRWAVNNCTYVTTIGVHSLYR